MNYIYWLSQIQHQEQHLVGDKLYILSQLLQDEHPVLPGFVLNCNLWRQFIGNADAELSKLMTEDFSENFLALQSVANRGCLMINQTTFLNEWQAEVFQAAQQLNSACLILKPIVIIPYDRHGGTDGLWRSHTCNNHPNALSTTIKLVWSELFSATSLLYCHKLGIDVTQLDLAILVTPLIDAYASGLVEVRDETIRISATRGLEHSLLQGDVEPDRYYLEHNTGLIISEYQGHKNYAYQTKQVDLTTPQFNCLESYLPNEMTSMVLSREAIAHLHKLIENVLNRQPQVKYLTWTAFESPFSTIPQFYFTWLNSYLTTADDTISQERTATAAESLEHLVSGIAVSSGSVQAEVVSIKDFSSYSGLIPPGSILVTKIIEPQHIALIKQAGGIITEIGGKTSHGAIIARELNIPAIVNAVNATEILHHGQRVWLNGDDGRVYPAQPAGQLSPRRIKLESPIYPIATKLMVNLSQPESIATASKLPVDGVGLLRSELLLANLLSDKTLAQWQKSFRDRFLDTLIDSLRQFTVAFAPRPIFYRSLDRYENSKNPVSISRGAFNYLNDPNNFFDLELEALAEILATGNQNLNLILPFVRSVEEFSYCYSRLSEVGLTTYSSFQVWIMAEVPSIIMLLPEYVRAGVQGIAIGTNDLTQLFLGVSREQPQFSARGLNANHPAMHKAIAELIEIAKANNIKCCICGQAPVEHPSLVEKLIEWGVDAISVEPEAVNMTYQAIARAEKRLLLQEVRGQNV